ncbi:M48 family metallopeptidase [Chitinophaga horti]|uniref:M48 family metallopeptidase n=1 Tax=Chitinophaga horti TaxID=2920382 RepID=A0ABY6IUX3_9BACT|nr:M48 family metallopeptidase [Chitinophaga horti]UYQ91161.1 M48 family metallopeptidase [Chitinophaga horti]
MHTSLYPPAPVVADKSVLQPSEGFRKQAIKVIFAIVLFMIVYLLLVAAAVGLAVACVYAGIWLLAAMSTITILLGVGLILLGASVLFFLVKFVFAVSKNENAGRIEILESEQPRLFDFIRQVATETNTPFPKKIFLSADVNACVFYNSSFWSMMLPVRKNLEIGLGLVNATNISEFKAVMAHEFGHFSQRSMKLGSFTYNVNRVIYNMLNENSSYTSFLQNWASIHGILALFAQMTAGIATGIQQVLRGMYGFINKSYSGLSQEMEFHADTIAASVAGGNNVISGLSRIEVAQGCYNTILQRAGEQFNQKKAFKNIFTNHLTVFRAMANEHTLPVKQGIPEVSFAFIDSFSKSRINFKDQWASHPPLAERKASLDKVGIYATPDETPAWAIFDHVEMWQEKFTKVIYRDVSLDDTETLDDRQFEAQYHGDIEKYKLPAAYKGFYSKRIPAFNKWELETVIVDTPVKSFNEIFTEKNAQLFSVLQQNMADKHTAQAIADGHIPVKSFDFDGVKHVKEDAIVVVGQIDKDIAALETEIDWNDQLAFMHFYQQQPSLKEDYARIIDMSKDHAAFVDAMTAMMEMVRPFYQERLTFDVIEIRIKDLKKDLEPPLKDALRKIVITDDALDKKRNDYLASDYVYFANEAFKNDELNHMIELAREVSELWDEQLHMSYKTLLIKQLKPVEA